MISLDRQPRREAPSIPLSRPLVDDAIKDAVWAAIASRHYILGAECREFEAALARALGARNVVLTSSGTAALWLIFRALGVKAGDEVLVPAHTAFPTVEALAFAGVTPVFVDVDDAYGLDVADAAAKVTSRTIGIVPVHLYGQPVDLDGVGELVSRCGIWSVEDCCQAIGARWRGRPVGSFSRASAFSFYPSKNLTVLGDGGAVATDDDLIADQCRRLRDHGRRGKDVHVEIGFNLRFNELNAAAGRVALGRLEAMNDRRRALAARYHTGLADLPVELPRERAAGRHVYHLFVIRTPARDALRSFLAIRGIETGIHYPVPAHRQPALRHLGACPLPATERLVDEILSLPISPGHTEAEIDEVVAALQEFFDRAG
jgi:dTDP-4-amino-4,6-dideoxygalactose transaminase